MSRCSWVRAQRPAAAGRRSGPICGALLVMSTTLAAGTAIAQSTVPNWWTTDRGRSSNFLRPCQNGQPNVEVPRINGPTKRAVGEAHFIARAAACRWTITELYEWNTYFCARATQPWGQPTGDCILPAQVPLEERDKTNKPETCPTHTPHPLYPLTGAKRLPIDLGVSLGGHALTWTYNTTRKVSFTGAAQDLVTLDKGAFGELGFGSLHRRVAYNPATRAARVTRGNGDVVDFVPGPAGGFVADPDIADTLAFDGAGFRYS